jgi:DNA-binding transcriptional MocR family regulator
MRRTEITASGWQPLYARRADHMKSSEIRELLKLLERPGIISFAGGIPDPALFPAAAAARAYANALATQASASAALQYSVSEGYGPLRHWIAEHMATRGVKASADNILITAGSQQALDFMGKLLLTAGDTVLVTNPSYLGALQAFSAYEPRYDTIRPEQSNRTPASYADGAANNAPGALVKLAYVVPDFANPTGETLSQTARQRLLDLAAELDVPVLEDSAYSALRFAGHDVPSLLALDVGPADRSIDHASSTLAPFRKPSHRRCASAGSARRRQSSAALCSSSRRVTSMFPPSIKSWRTNSLRTARMRN